MNLSFFSKGKGWKIVVMALGLFGTFLAGRIATTGHLPSFDFKESSVFDRPTAESFFRYSPPDALKRLTNEWEPQQALVLTQSFPESRKNPDIARYQIELLAAATRYVDVYVLGEHNHHQAYAHFLALLESHPDAEAILERTHFVDSRDLMRWARDFGPIFGVNRQNGLVAIDFVYRDLVWELEGELQEKKDPERIYLTMQGDAMPADLVSYLQRQTDQVIKIVRPPLSMDGGDFVSDGEGNIFISTRTLMRNGRDRLELEQLFKQYFNAKKLHVLEALPGGTVHHLDMILKFVADRTLMLPDYQTSVDPPLNPYQTELIKSVRKTLDHNERYIRKHFPKYRIIKVPMPPILQKTAKEILVDAQEEFVRIAATEQNLIPANAYAGLHPTERAEIKDRVFAMVKKETGISDPTSYEGFDTVLQQYGQMSMREYLSVHAESVTRYRSYINSVFLHNKTGEQTFILPRFTSSDTAEQARLGDWEREVAAAYRDAYPQAEIQWINCDSMVADMGFVHCTTMTVPAFPRG